MSISPTENVFIIYEKLAQENPSMPLGRRGLARRTIPIKIGCGNMLMSKWTIPPLTTIEQYTHQMGQQSVEMLLQLMENKMNATYKVRVIEPRLVIRKSCRNV